MLSLDAMSLMEDLVLFYGSLDKNERLQAIMDVKERPREFTLINLDKSLEQEILLVICVCGDSMLMRIRISLIM